MSRARVFLFTPTYPMDLTTVPRFAVGYTMSADWDLCDTGRGIHLDRRGPQPTFTHDDDGTLQITASVHARGNRVVSVRIAPGIDVDAPRVIAFAKDIARGVRDRRGWEECDARTHHAGCRVSLITRPVRDGLDAELATLTRDEGATA